MKDQKSLLFRYLEPEKNVPSRVDTNDIRQNKRVLFMLLCRSLYVLVYYGITQDCPSLLFVTEMLHRYKTIY